MPSVHKRVYAQNDVAPDRPSVLFVDHKSQARTPDAVWSERPPLLPGWFTALATPFENGGIAQKAFSNLVAWQIEQGTRGSLFAALSEKRKFSRRKNAPC